MFLKIIVNNVLNNEKQTNIKKKRKYFIFCFTIIVKTKIHVAVFLFTVRYSVSSQLVFLSKHKLGFGRDRQLLLVCLCLCVAWLWVASYVLVAGQRAVSCEMVIIAERSGYDYRLPECSDASSSFFGGVSVAAQVAESLWPFLCKDGCVSSVLFFYGLFHLLTFQLVVALSLV